MARNCWWNPRIGIVNPKNVWLHLQTPFGILALSTYQHYFFHSGDCMPMFGLALLTISIVLYIRYEQLWRCILASSEMPQVSSTVHQNNKQFRNANWQCEWFTSTIGPWGSCQATDYSISNRCADSISSMLLRRRLRLYTRKLSAPQDNLQRSRLAIVGLLVFQGRSSRGSGSSALVTHCRTRVVLSC